MSLKSAGLVILLGCTVLLGADSTGVSRRYGIGINTSGITVRKYFKPFSLGIFLSPRYAVTTGESIEEYEDNSYYDDEEYATANSILSLNTALEAQSVPFYTWKWFGLSYNGKIGYSFSSTVYRTEDAEDPDTYTNQRTHIRTNYYLSNSLCLTAAFNSRFHLEHELVTLKVAYEDYYSEYLSLGSNDNLDVSDTGEWETDLSGYGIGLNTSFTLVILF